MALKLGEMLVRAGVITEEQLTQGLLEQKKNGGRIGTNLVKLGFTTEEKITEFLGKQYGVQAIDLGAYELDKNVLKLVPPGVAQKYDVVPFAREGKVLKVVMVNPANLFAIEDIKFTTGFEVEPMVAAESSIKRAIEQHYQHQAVLDTVMSEVEKLEGVEVVEEEEEMGDLAAQVQSGPVVQLVNKILMDAVDQQVSDIHIEPYDKDLRIRHRIDGILHEAMKPPWTLRKAIVSRLKIMAKLKIAEKRLPQDGRISVRVRGKPVDFRVSTVPTMYGEKMSLRVLDRSVVSFDLNLLGFEEEALIEYNRAAGSPFGIVLVTGPTGCGKTTTLYATLTKINSPTLNIITAEDPIEYSLMGVNQVQMKENVGLTFASALRSYLRQDPNIVMVGEIRDHETAEIAIRASLTGHLVLSTVHTNNAPATITRLVNMGVEPFLIASTLNLVESQRLVRKICPHCKEPVEVDPEYLRSLGIDPDELDGTIYKGKGCGHCHRTGYRGRTGIFEVLPVTPNVREMILDRATTDELYEAAEKEGMMSLRKAALRKLRAGVIDLDEVIRETIEQ